jgi:ADP-heptose:LPS heptosyltransferase
MLSEAYRQHVAEAARLVEDRSRKGQVILVYGLGSFGDVTQITGLLRSLRAKFAGAQIVVIHNDLLGASLVENSPFIDQYIRLRGPLQPVLQASLRPETWDLAVECRYVIKYILSASARLAADQIAFIEAAQSVQKEWMPLIQNFPFDNDRLWRAAKDRGWSMYGLMAHTAGFPDADFEQLQIDPPRERPSLTEFKLPPAYAVVSNSAEWLALQSSLWTKCLPHARMREVLQELSRRKIPTVLLGTGNDPGDYPVDVDLRGRSNLLQAAEVIRQSRLILGPEGGAVNLARAVGIPSVVFFGSTPVEFFGFRSNLNIAPHVCGGCWWTTETYLRHCPLLEPIPPCTASITAAEIVAAVEKLFHRTV